MVESKLNIDRMIIKDNENNEIYYGGDQEWFSTDWQKKAGCGPTTAATMILYEYSKNQYDRLSFLRLMESLWNYITPTSRGVDTLERFAEGYKKYVKDQYNLFLKIFYLNIVEDINQRQSNEFIFLQLNKAVQTNHPIAFLNLHQGKEKKLYTWHWVTLVSLSYDKYNDELRGLIIDEGLLKSINLGLWLKTSQKGGGFVWFEEE